MLLAAGINAQYAAECSAILKSVQKAFNPL